MRVVLDDDVGTPGNHNATYNADFAWGFLFHPRLLYRPRTGYDPRLDLDISMYLNSLDRYDRLVYIVHTYI